MPVNGMRLVEQVRRLVQDTSRLFFTDAEIIALISVTRGQLFDSRLNLLDAQQEALVIVAAFRLLQARDAAMQLEAMATVQG